MSETILTVVLTIVVVTIASALYFGRILRRRDWDYGSDPRVYGKGRRKKALVLHQPSRHGSSVQIAEAMALELEKEGYEVTVDYPGKMAKYNPQDYEFLSFSGAAYMGHVGKPVLDFVKTHNFFHKKVIVFTVGTVKKDPTDLKELVEAIPQDNLVLSIKVNSLQQADMMDFVKNALK